LERLLTGAARQADDQVTARILAQLRANPGRASHFLEAFNLLDDATARQLVAQGQLAAFVKAERVLRTIQIRGATEVSALLNRRFAGSIENLERFLNRLAPFDETQRGQALAMLLTRRNVTPEGLILTLETTGRLPPRVAGGPTVGGGQGGASLAQRQFAATLRIEAQELERYITSFRREAVDLERRASLTTRADRAARLREQAAVKRRTADSLEEDIALLRREANEFDQGQRPVPADLPGPEDFEAMFAEARTETWIRVKLDPSERDPSSLVRLMRPVLQSRTGNRVVFRVEGGTDPTQRSQGLIQIGPGGEVNLTTGTTLNLNFGVAERAIEFLRQGRRGAQIKVFEVDETWFRSLRSSAIPERGVPAPLRDIEGQPVQGPPSLSEIQGRPRLVDVRFGEDQLQIPPNLTSELQQFIIPGSGRVVEFGP
jgi:hypothetical protein